MDMEREKGMEIKSAQKEVSSVPTKKGRAPNTPNTGSHVLEKKKLIPNFLVEGKEFMERVVKMERRSSSRQRAEKRRTPLNTASEMWDVSDKRIGTFLTADCKNGELCVFIS